MWDGYEYLSYVNRHILYISFIHEDILSVFDSWFLNTDFECKFTQSWLDKWPIRCRHLRGVRNVYRHLSLAKSAFRSIKVRKLASLIHPLYLFLHACSVHSVSLHKSCALRIVPSLPRSQKWPESGATKETLVLHQIATDHLHSLDKRCQLWLSIFYKPLVRIESHQLARSLEALCIAVYTYTILSSMSREG